MGAAGQRLQRQPGDRAAFDLGASEHRPAGLRRQSAGLDLHPPAPVRVEPAERQIDQALWFLGAALDDRPIGLADFALLEQPPKLLEGLVMAAEHHAARGFAIEPMRKRRLSRQAEAQGVEIFLEPPPPPVPFFARHPRPLFPTTPTPP